MKKSVIVLIVILAFSLVSLIPAFADNEGSCQLSLVSLSGNHAEFSLNNQSDSVVDIDFHNGGNPSYGPGLTNFPHDFTHDHDYDQYTVTATVQGSGRSCGSVNIEIGTRPVGSNGQVYVATSPTAQCWNLVAINVVAGKAKNKVDVWLTVMGELSDYPFTINFGDTATTDPVRDGDHTVLATHSYDAKTLANGVDISVTIQGTSQVCLSVHIDSKHRTVTAVRG